MSSEFILHIPNISLAEFDIGGVLYHSRYFQLYETAREAFLREVGCSYPALVKKGNHLAVIESHQRFIKPVTYGLPVAVHLSTRELKRTSFVFDYEIKSPSQQNVVLHTAFTRHAFIQIDGESFLPTVTPESLRHALERIAKQSAIAPRKAKNLTGDAQ